MLSTHIYILAFPPLLFEVFLFACMLRTELQVSSISDILLYVQDKLAKTDVFHEQFALQNLFIGVLLH